MTNSRNPPPAPKKPPYKGIRPSSEYYTENNNDNITNENVENLEELEENNFQKMVKETRSSPGNRNPNYSRSILNFKPKVPKMKLPAGLKGGKRKTRKGKKLSRKYTRKH